MTIYELELLLASECYNWPGEMVARLYYKYCGDTELHKSDEVFSVDEDGKIIWFSDWYEGQEEIVLIGFYRIEYLIDYYRRGSGTYE